jgi:hypothetical protein
MNENEMGRPCGRNVGEEKCIPGFDRGPKGKRHLGRPRFSWRLLKFILNK